MQKEKEEEQVIKIKSVEIEKFTTCRSSKFLTKPLCREGFHFHELQEGKSK